MSVSCFYVVRPAGRQVRIGVDDGRRETRNRNNESLFGGYTHIVRLT